MKKILGIIFSLLIMTQAYASLAVSPTKIEINANKIKTNYVTTAIEVRGDSQQVMRFKAYTGYFGVNSKGEYEEMESTGDKCDISKKIRFVPSEFNVFPGKTQKLRINISGINSLVDGENRAMLYIEDVNPKEQNLDLGIAGIGAQLIVKTRMGIPIYVDKGKFTKSADVESFSLIKEKGDYYLNLKVNSTGTTRVRYNAKAQIIDGKNLIAESRLDSHLIPAGGSLSTKSKIAELNIPKTGEYTLRLILTYNDENDKRKNITKDIKINVQGEM